jgi:hypothetical protein
MQSRTSERSGQLVIASREVGIAEDPAIPFLFRRKTMGAAIDVLQAPDDHMPIGIAMSAGPNRAGVAVWRLIVRKTEVPGLWVIVDREFRAVE